MITLLIRTNSFISNLERIGCNTAGTPKLRIMILYIYWSWTNAGFSLSLSISYNMSIDFTTVIKNCGDKQVYSPFYFLFAD